MYLHRAHYLDTRELFFFLFFFLFISFHFTMDTILFFSFLSSATPFCILSPKLIFNRKVKIYIFNSYNKCFKSISVNSNNRRRKKKYNTFLINEFYQMAKCKDKIDKNKKKMNELIHLITLMGRRRRK